MNQRPSTITHKTSQTPPLQATEVELISKKHRKKKPNKLWVKGFTGGLFKTTILAAILLGGNDYQITTVIQLHASNHGAHKSHYTYQTPQVLAAPNRNTSHAR